ncbi:hypothetical protein I7331_36615, partial [Frankia sp. AgB1.8]|nr:hypothetical protein [Frankia sp. AgB1.8]
LTRSRTAPLGTAEERAAAMAVNPARRGRLTATAAPAAVQSAHTILAARLASSAD